MISSLVITLLSCDCESTFLEAKKEMSIHHVMPSEGAYLKTGSWFKNGSKNIYAIEDNTVTLYCLNSADKQIIELNEYGSNYRYVSGLNENLVLVVSVYSGDVDPPSGGY